MRYALIATTLFLCLAFVPKKDKSRERYVYDNEQDFTAQEIQRLDTLFRGHEARTGNEIVLVTTASYLGWPTIFEFAGTVGDSLRVGKRGRNNGVIIAFSKERREVFIATGLGTEQVMSEDHCQKLVDSLMLPPLKESRYFDGIWAGSTAVVNHLDLPENAIK
ncbi:MAG: TPM domain-containing protein [Bacteroidetes bacterium]|nr:TPM domain-containing protein [Bacteroidota bacterium]MBX7128475.1 TPM domain-containing protein [Flavobacteriales bacterium]MCC6655053.1 TPM domain-containing protein [Flavobacteriales bacterium]HMU14913.1 TPM domain-containing protein [Flavobacteriales bacterium]HMZ48319.1 TPM domain-containing protein [Flavobacteriales bacterium]